MVHIMLYEMEYLFDLISQINLENYRSNLQTLHPTIEGN